MVFLMKLHEYKDALLTANKRHQQLEKEIEDKKGRWIAKASAKIEDVVKSTFCQAEECETQLERLRRDEGKAVSEWQLKLEHAEKRLAHVTAARDWLEEAVVHTRERITMMEGEKLSLQGELDSERQRRLGLEGDARALALTLRESTQQTKSKDLQFKEHEMKQLLAALETANHRLETQQNVNAAIMRKKEEVRVSHQEL
uniref:Uncharacterized protein n=1 Tax=Physcomitrium patens TaxID=3218 RepID=A0A7I4AK42_PHYPA